MAYTINHESEEEQDLWQEWKITVPRHRRLQDRIHELVELDLQCHEEFGIGIYELMDAIDADEIESQLE